MIRLSGPAAHQIARAHLDHFPEKARNAKLATFFDADEHAIDQVVVTRYDHPHSYTGEDLVEISAHGGLVGPTRIAEQLIHSGARPADAGEFTRRAVLHGKLDLLQAEAVSDVIDAQSRAVHRAAVQQLDRGLSRRVEELRQAILHVEALLAYDIDFPDEDDGPVSRDRITSAAEHVLRQIGDLTATVPMGELLREGAVVVIAGGPNVGKSSLFNALIGRARAIVTDIPGTTRDALESVIEGDRWPLRLVDTAGLRATEDTVERLGVELTGRHIAAADVVLACEEDPALLQRSVRSVLEQSNGAAVIATRTKSDLATRDDYLASADVGRMFGQEIAASVAVSSETGAGLRELIAAIEAVLDIRVGRSRADTPILTRARHKQVMRCAEQEVAGFLAAWTERALPATVAAVHLRAAAGALEDLIGNVDVDDVLDVVFSTFCVGK